MPALTLADYRALATRLRSETDSIRRHELTHKAADALDELCGAVEADTKDRNSEAKDAAGGWGFRARLTTSEDYLGE